MRVARTISETLAPVRLGWLAAILGTLLAAPFVLALALGNSISHDEHQHIAAGVLFAREGLVPYRDFAYFHVPYLVYAYGLLFSLTDHYLLASRLFSAACASLTCGGLAWVAWRALAHHSKPVRILFAAGSVLAFLSAPVVGETIGHSWNQEPSVLLILLAFLCHQAALDHQRPGRWFLVSGILTGLAIGMRITLAPVVLPMMVALWFPGAAHGSRFRLLLTYAGGLALALIGLVAAFAYAPQAFIFANVEFPEVNIAYRYSVGEPRTMTLGKKLRFMFKEVMRPNWFVFYGFLAAWLVAAIRLKMYRSVPRPVLTLLLVFPFLMMGALAPSPSFDQYYYPLVPFLILGALYFFGSLPREGKGLRWIWSSAGALCVTAILIGARPYEDIAELFHPKEWGVSELHAEAMELRRDVPPGVVLTLAPSLVLEAGLDIYPAFATGPFAWRVASMIATERRPGLDLIAPPDLPHLLQTQPPSAIITGEEDQGELPIEAFARENAFRRVTTEHDRIIWLPTRNM